MLRRSSSLAFLYVSIVFIRGVVGKDAVCQWKSLTGTHYDLRPLTVKEGGKMYFIKDGDIPCTPETEPTYSYLWNFCANVPKSALPTACDPNVVTNGAAVQYLDRLSDGYKECHVIGRYDSTHDDIHYKILDERNPAYGVSMKYPLGESCPDGTQRSATIDVICDNVKSVIDSAQEPTACEYHMVMKSYHGCPTECPITSNGLCNSHGHCAYDYVKKSAYCYCNSGYTGDSCSSKTSSESDSGLTTQIALLVVLLIVVLGLVGVIGFMIYKITLLRKERADENNYAALSDGTELVKQRDGKSRF